MSIWLKQLPPSDDEQGYHGHTFKLKVQYEANGDQKERTEVFLKTLSDQLSYRDLQTTIESPQASVEWLALWFGERCIAQGIRLVSIEIKDTPTSGVFIPYPQ